MNILDLRLSFSNLAAAVLFTAAPITASSGMVCAPKSADQAQSDCQLAITTHPATIYCMEQDDAVYLPLPKVNSTCGGDHDLSYRDLSFNLGCSVTGFTGFFESKRWTLSKINGDGGVDVTGAPNSILVEGANTSPEGTALGFKTRFQTVIPAEGYVVFDWRKFGGSNLFSIAVNGTPERLTGRGDHGNFMSSLLHVGDTLSIELYSQTASYGKVALANFEFLTNAIEVIERHWTATDRYGNSTKAIQLISKERATLAHVLIPVNRDGVVSPKMDDKASIHPDATGYPFIDKDGQLQTTHDQFSLDQGACAFQLDWEDQLFSTSRTECTVIRKWIITDWCSGSIMEETQIIKLLKTDPAAGCPNPTSDDNQKQEGVTEPVPLYSNPATAGFSLVPPVKASHKHGEHCYYESSVSTS